MVISGLVRNLDVNTNWNDGFRSLSFAALYPADALSRTGDVPLDAQQQRAHAQEDGADNEVDAEEFSALRGAIRNE